MKFSDKNDRYKNLSQINEMKSELKRLGVSPRSIAKLKRAPKFQSRPSRNLRDRANCKSNVDEDADFVSAAERKLIKDAIRRSLAVSIICFLRSCSLFHRFSLKSPSRCAKFFHLPLASNSNSNFSLCGNSDSPKMPNKVLLII